MNSEPNKCDADHEDLRANLNDVCGKCGENLREETNPDPTEASTFIAHFLGNHNSATNVDVLECGCVQKLITQSKISELAMAHRANNSHDYDNETDEYIDERLEQLKKEGEAK